MDFFKTIGNMFSTADKSAEVEVWQEVVTEEDITSIFESSKQKPQIVLKHSSSCGISFFAMKSLNIPEIIDNDNIDLHLIDVIRHRTISHSFAEKVSVRHESPQVFVIKNGEIKWHGSHNSVNSKNVLDHI